MNIPAYCTHAYIKKLWNKRIIENAKQEKLSIPADILVDIYYNQIVHIVKLL